MARLIRPDGTEEQVKPKNIKGKWTLEEVQTHVGGYVILLPRCPRAILVDEDGLPKQLKPNAAANIAVMEILGAFYPQTLVGNVLILDKKEKF
jgi:Domain of unknown function (DUF3846)